MGIALVVVRDNELDVGDDEAASSDIAEGGTARKARGSHVDGPGNNSMMGVITIHVGERNRTSEDWE